MKLTIIEDFNCGIKAIVRNSDNSYVCDAEILAIKRVENRRGFDFCHITAAAEIHDKKIELEGNFYI